MGINFRIALLGAGNLGSALIAGLLKARAIPSDHIVATVRTQDHANALARAYPVRVNPGDNAEAISHSDVVIVAVKPAAVGEVLAEIRGVLTPHQILVSFAAGIPLSQIEQRLRPKTPVFRAMPNLAMRVCQSATAISAGALTTAEQRGMIARIFQPLGTLHYVDDDAMHAVTSLAGSGPGFLYWMMEAFAEGGIQAGLDPAVSRALTSQTFLGASQLVRETGQDPSALRRQVTTPGGTTAAGVAELENQGARQAIIAAISAATQRSRESAETLSGGSAPER